MSCQNSLRRRRREDNDRRPQSDSVFVTRRRLLPYSIIADYGTNLSREESAVDCDTIA